MQEHQPEILDETDSRLSRDLIAGSTFPQFQLLKFSIHGTKLKALDLDRLGQKEISRWKS